MRFDASQWIEVDCGVPQDGPVGSLRVNTSMPAALWVYDVDATQVLVGYGTSFDVDLVGLRHQVRFAVEGPKACRAFVHWPDLVHRRARDGSFTNPNRPDQMQSSVMDAVLGELRRFKLQAQQELRLAQRETRRQRRDEDWPRQADDGEAVDDPPEPAPAP